MLRASRKRTRNKISVRKAPFDKSADASSPPSANEAKKRGVQPSSAPATNGSATVPEGPAKTIVTESVTAGSNDPSSRVVSQSASNSPKRFKSRSSVTNRSLSPARFYREREQSELQTLNDRLSSHLDTVKKLQCENASLRLQVQGLEILRVEKDTRKHFHQSDITTLQDMLDTSRQESNSLEQTLQITRKERDSLRQSLVEREEDVSLLEIRVENIKSVSQQCTKMESELKTLRETLKEKEADAKRLSDDLVKEKMTRKRLEEEAQINKSCYIKEMEEASLRMNRHLETTDQKLEAGYEVMVNDALTSVREQNSRDLSALKEELTTVYQTKLSDWKSKAERSNADLLASRKELKAVRAEVDALRAQTTRLKMESASLKVQIEEDQSNYTELKNESEKEACQQQREMVILKQELAEVKDELEEMGGANMRLEREIATYRVLLDDLESKSPFTKRVKDDRHKKDSEPPSADQKEVAECESRNTPDVYLRTNEMDKGVGIGMMDVDGRYLSVINRADHLVDMCLWTVVQSTYNKKIKFEIPHSTPVTSDQRLYIWSDGEGPFKDKPSCDQILSLPDDAETRDFYCIHTTTAAATTTTTTANSMTTTTTTSTTAAHRTNNSSYSGRSGILNNSSASVIVTDNSSALSKSDMLTGTDAIHISMQGKRWIRKPQFMNLRLEDGDSQLQAKCDFTIINKYTMGLGSDSATLHIGGKQTKKMTSSHGGSGQQQEGGLRGNESNTGTPSIQQDCNATRMRVSNNFDDKQMLTKDGCIVM